MTTRILSMTTITAIAGEEGDILSIGSMLVEIEVEVKALALDRDGLTGLVSVASACAGASSSWIVGAESSSSSEDDKTGFFRRGRPCAMLPAELCLW